MRRQTIEQPDRAGACAFRPIFTQLPQVMNHRVNLSLLAHDHQIELVQQVLRKARLDFQLGQSFATSVIFSHVAIEPENPPVTGASGRYLRAGMPGAARVYKLALSDPCRVRSALTYPAP